MENVSSILTENVENIILMIDMTSASSVHESAGVGLKIL